MAFTNNYATSFRYLDRIFGTDTKYHAYKQRLAEAKKVTRLSAHKESHPLTFTFSTQAREAELAKAGISGGVSREEEKQIESKLLEETEREGIKAEREAERGSVWKAKTKVL